MNKYDKKQKVEEQFIRRREQKICDLHKNEYIYRDDSVVELTPNGFSVVFFEKKKKIHIFFSPNLSIYFVTVRAPRGTNPASRRVVASKAEPV